LAALLVTCFAAACAEPAAPAEEPCAITTTIPGGTAEVGLGETCARITEGQDVTLTCGTQGLYMFIVNVRVHDMDVNDSAHLGGVGFVATGQDGTKLSLAASGCRSREFVVTDDGLIMTGSYGLATDINLLSQIDGARVTITVDVRDHLGRHAVDSRIVTAHIPVACAN
jgi:hypothetical protein